MPGALLLTLATILLTACEDEDGEGERAVTLEQAREMYALGKPREALDAALALARDPPLVLEDRVALAGFLTRMGASGRAVEILDAWDGGLTTEGEEVLARALLKSGSAARAMDLLRALSARGGGSARVQKLLGMAACSREDWAEAGRLLEAARIGAPFDPECWAWLAWARVGAGKADRGVRLLREGRREFPESWEIRAMLAAILFKLRPDDETVLREVATLAEWVAERHPFDPASRARLGAALGRLGRHARSEEVMLDLVADYPAQVGYRIDLGIAQVRGGRPLKAVATFESAVPLAPRDIRLLLNLGLAYLEACAMAHDPAEFAGKSRATFMKVVALDPGCVDGYIGMARATMRPDPRDNRLVKEAIGHYQDALKVDPDSFPANLNVALLYYDLTIGSEQAVAVRDDWFQKALQHFRAAESVVDVSQWDRGAREAFETLKGK